MNTEPEPLTVQIEGDGDTLLVHVAGELDVASTPELRDQLLQATPPGTRRIDFDLADLSFLDSSGLALLVGVARDHEVRVVAASEIARRVLEITGLATTLNLEA